MANVKISQLPTASAVTSDDFLPIVDSGSTTTQQASFDQVLNFVTSSTFNELNVGTLSASVLYVSASVIENSGSTKFGDTLDDTHQFTGSILQTGSGATSVFKDSINVFGNLSASINISASAFYGDGSGITGVTAEWDGSHVGNASITGSLYVTQTVSASAITGSSVEATTITGSIVSASNFYGDGSGITGVTAEWDGSHTGDASITGSLDVTQAITASFLDVSGTTDFGNIAQSITDYHKFTGSVGIRFDGSGTGNQSNDRAFRVTRNADDKDTFVVYDNGFINVRNGTSTSFMSVGSAGSAYLSVNTSGIDVRGKTRIITSQSPTTARFVHSNDTDSGLGFPANDTVSIILNSQGAATFSSGSDGHLMDVSGSLVANVALSGAVGSEIADSSYSLSADDRGKTLIFSSSAIQGITCSSGLEVGFNATFIQMGSGQLELSASSGVSLLNRQSHTKTAGTYAAASVVIISADTYIFSGDTSA